MKQYKLPSGRQVTVDSEPFDSSGGEADIYEVMSAPDELFPLGSNVEGPSDILAKIYGQKDRNQNFLRQKLKAALKVGPPGQNDAWPDQNEEWFAWPKTPLSDRNGSLAGYLMRKVRGTSFYAIMKPHRRANQQPQLGRGGLYVIAVNLAYAVERLHREGHAIGDFRPKDVIVTSEGVTLIDCDSYEIRDRSELRIYPCLVGRPEYTAPEYQGKSHSSYHGEQAADRFVLAVLLFRLFMAGTHPFSGRYPNASQNRLGGHIKRGRWPYAAGNAAKPQRGAMSLDLLPPLLQEAFRTSFVEGHGRPDRRLSPGRWRTVLNRARRRLRECQRGHKYSSHLGSKCPWCGDNGSTNSGEVASFSSIFG